MLFPAIAFFCTRCPVLMCIYFAKNLVRLFVFLSQLSFRSNRTSCFVEITINIDMIMMMNFAAMQAYALFWSIVSIFFFFNPTAVQCGFFFFLIVLSASVICPLFFFFLLSCLPTTVSAHFRTLLLPASLCQVRLVFFFSYFLPSAFIRRFFCTLERHITTLLLSTRACSKVLIACILITQSVMWLDFCGVPREASYALYT